MEEQAIIFASKWKNLSSKTLDIDQVVIVNEVEETPYGKVVRLLGKEFSGHKIGLSHFLKNFEKVKDLEV